MSPLEQRPELIEHGVAYVVADVFERLPDPSSGASLAEAFLKCETGAGVEFALLAGSDKTHRGYYCAFFYYGRGKETELRNVKPLHLVDSEFRPSSGRAHNMQGAMLVDVGQHIEELGGVIYRTVPALIRLQGLDLLPNAPVVLPVVIEYFEDGEHRITVGPSTIEENELPRQVVERGSGVMCKVSYQDAPPSRQRLDASDAKKAIAGLRLFIDHHAIMVRPVEIGDLFLEVRKMYIRPLQLLFAADQGGRHGY